MNLSTRVKYTEGLAYASGTASRNGAELDMSGWDGVLILCKCATIASGASGDIHVEQDTATGMASAADLTGTAQAIVEGDSDKLFVIDLYKPQEQFVRAVVTKDGSHAQAETVLYIQYAGDKLPVSDMGADSYELHVSPAEGTK